MSVLAYLFALKHQYNTPPLYYRCYRLDFYVFQAGTPPSVACVLPPGNVGGNDRRRRQ